ncbi:hypothetical protein ABB37_07754 [Leptomonas pyrrhocoris]|uniref:Uncharacterized protein n=1 Tax=Leptomonas pyrrhocoris TaxID=157538 RepID=A0A0M9FUV7_LEPPY|nr:hypothetical protein ABB37_07754 [Leptomonas pyrrhocoris]KPA76429.1 hypothetical protein ABB37_07754 [Leptomonas pyrrhocoris]|eukprot:XP_015654868.1 hypothetical protein ABB37_07754 [Leptomonas pyrrhocoris]
MPPRSSAAARSTGGDGTALSVSTRARQDPRRRIGNGNAVAGGLDLSRVGVLSDRELAFFHRLACASAQSAEQRRLDARRSEEERRRELSKARTATWPDTIEARHDLFLKTQQDAKDAAEARQRVLDELYAEQLKEERNAMIARQELAQLKEDPRGSNARSMTLLHETLKGRAEQVAYKQHCKQEEEAAAADTQRQLQLQAWGDQTEAMQKKLAARQRNMEEKNTNLETVLYQINELRQARAAEKQEGVRVAQEAAEERAEQAAEDAERRARELENGEFNKSHARTALTKSQRLQERLADNKQNEAAMRAEEARRDGMKAWVMEKQQQKRDAFERRKETALLQHLEEAVPEKAPTYRTQDVFEQKGQSFLQRMHDGDVQRREQEKQHRSELQREMEERANGTSSNAQSRHHGAATTAGGFLNAEEERAYAAEMRRYPEQIRAQEAQEAAARRAEAQRVEEILKLQAAEKRENARRAIEARREEARQQQGCQALEDARYGEYIDSIVPADMDPVLYRKAKQLQ